MDLLVASNNNGKIREIRSLLSSINICSPSDLEIKLNVEETGNTFLENATLKAQAFAQKTGLISLADDSGLQVDALNGAPGVHSARYGNINLDDSGRCQFLLDNLQLFPTLDERKARFCCVIVVAAPDGRLCFSEGICEGHIAKEFKGTEGFGYDPIFFLKSLNCTMAQLPVDIKNTISHRARALEIIRPKITELFPEIKT